jgi:hypothetical protein
VVRSQPRQIVHKTLSCELVTEKGWWSGSRCTPVPKKKKIHWVAWVFCLLVKSGHLSSFLSLHPATLSTLLSPHVCPGLSTFWLAQAIPTFPLAATSSCSKPSSVVLGLP